ncbi:MAG: single-stranded-DNA-specific exonuclease RecJ, partial [bacterium]
MKKTWKQKNINKNLFKKLNKHINDPLLCAIASIRNYGINDYADFESFLDNNIQNLTDPNNIPNVDKIVDLFTSPPNTIYIFGDYDVDGTFSSYMLRNILYSNGCKDVNYFIPHRKSDGYGLNNRSLINFIEKAKHKNIDLVVFLDCGTNSKNEIELLKQELNEPKIVIIDHHIIDKEKYASNADIIINNRLSKNCIPYCTGGLVYQIARKLKNKLKFNPDRLLPYAAITTIADVSPLYGDNRIIVANGLKKMKTIKNNGLLELIRVSDIDIDSCSVEDISFKLAPRLNANGRISHAEEVVNLLMEKDEDEAFGMALKMNSINDKRKKFQKNKIKHAINKIGEDFDDDGIVFYNEKWEIGIVGIVASRLTETYGVPSIVFGNHEGQIKGSARSVNGI